MNEAHSKKIKPKKPAPLTRERLEALALRYVTRYASTQGMLGRVLQRHIDKAAFHYDDFSAQDALEWKRTILKKFTDKNWVNDGDIAKRMVEQAGVAGFSRQRLAQKLMQKGIDRKLIEETVRRAVDDGMLDGDDLSSAINFARKKKLGPYRRGKDGDIKKDLARMGRAGFAYDVSKKALNAVLDDD